MIDKMIIDADLCIKLGGSAKYQYLHDILPLVAKQVFMHTHAYGEVLTPSSAVNQLKELINKGKVTLVNENNLENADRVVYDAAFKNLEKIMINPKRPNKNRGEVCSLAYAKATGIPVFATDEKDLQPIIDKARDGEINVPRKVCKALWIISGKSKETFDQSLWPVSPK